jgi:hypothetical protein
MRAANRGFNHAFSLTSFSENTNFCKVTAKSEIGWHNSGVQTVFVDRRNT